MVSEGTDLAQFSKDLIKMWLDDHRKPNEEWGQSEEYHLWQVVSAHWSRLDVAERRGETIKSAIIHKNPHGSGFTVDYEFLKDDDLPLEMGDES